MINDRATIIGHWILDIGRWSSWALQDLNLGPTDYESAALTAELRARMMASRLPHGRPVTGEHALRSLDEDIGIHHPCYAILGDERSEATPQAISKVEVDAVPTDARV